MQNPNQRGPYGRGRDFDRPQNLRQDRNEDRWDEARYGGAYGSAQRGYDEQDYGQETSGYRDTAEERGGYQGYRGGQSTHGFDQDRFERGAYYGGAREYGSGSRQYRDEEPSRELYSSHSRGGQPYEWRQGQGRQPGNRQNWQSQSGYYRNRDDEDYGNRYQAGDYGRDQGSRYSGGYGRQDSDYSGNRYSSEYGRNQGAYSQRDFGQRDFSQRGYGQRDYGGAYGQSSYGSSGAEGVYGYGSSRYDRYGMNQDPYGREYGNQGSYPGGAGNPAQRYAGQDYQGPSQAYQDQNYLGQGGYSQSHRGQEHGSYQGQSYRGRGPKNYTRSDERIREDLSEKLSNHHYIDASDVNVEVKNGVVTLSGTVEQRHLKHEIEDMAEHCSGVKDVENRLTVSQRNQSGNKSGQQSTQQAGSKNETTGSDNTAKKH